MVLCVWFLLVLNTSASDCLERLVPEMICVERDVELYSLTHSFVLVPEINFDIWGNVLNCAAVSVIICEVSVNVCVGDPVF